MMRRHVKRLNIKILALVRFVINREVVIVMEITLLGLKWNIIAFVEKIS